MVQELNQQGYVVDYCDLWKVTGADIDWNAYDIVIDNWDNLKYAPPESRPTKVAFMNGWYWLEQNSRELERIRWFKERTGIIVPPNRQVAPNFSDEYADYLTYYGTQMQADSFSSKPKKHLINLCGLCGPAPTYQKKDIAKSRNTFMWIGGGGMLHKGLDIIMEAFARIPEATLIIAGNPKEEPRFWQWAEPMLAHHHNLKWIGWADTTSAEFDTVANQCIATVYASCSEGGPATVARVLFNGQIPIVTKTSFVRAESLGYLIEGDTYNQLLTATINQVRHVMNLPTADLAQKSEAVRDFAERNHTREAFTESFRSLLKNIQHS